MRDEEHSRSSMYQRTHGRLKFRGNTENAIMRLKLSPWREMVVVVVGGWWCVCVCEPTCMSAVA